jgi:hypothetical protein
VPQVGVATTHTKTATLRDAWVTRSQKSTPWPLAMPRHVMTCRRVTSMESLPRRFPRGSGVMARRVLVGLWAVRLVVLTIVGEGRRGGLGDGRRGGFGNGGNGNGRGEGGFGDDTVANRLTNNVVGDDDPFVVHAAVPKKTGGRMRGLWDEAKHLGLTVEKLAGIGHYGGGSGRLDDGDGLGADEMAASSSSSDRSTTNPQHVTTQRKSIKPTSNTDDGLDWDFDREMSARPKELGDDGEDDEETEAAETSQQKLFDKEAMNRAAPKKRGVFW